MASSGKSRALLPILIGGLIAGTLDISYACIYSYIRRGTKPWVVLQSVASGALGQPAFTGGAKTAALGLAFHFLIALIAATVYYFASRVISFMITHAVISGIVFGICVYLVMNLVVLPLSRIPVKVPLWAYPWPSLIGGTLIHMFGIGLPIALVVRKFSKQTSS
jgi:uncharacterized membrane protein YagU involved in acid resistance